MVDTESVDSSVVSTKVVNKRALWTFPFLDIVATSGTGGERELGGMNGE